MPKKQAKSSRTSEPASFKYSHPPKPLILGDPLGADDFGFIVHAPGLLDQANLVMGFMSASQWSAAIDLIKRGYTLAFFAGETIAPAIAAECAQRLKVPTVVHYVKDELRLYVAKNDRNLSPVVKG